MWSQAFREILRSDFQLLWAWSVWPFLGAALGASFGGYRRWYGARWQVGFLLGFCIGLQINSLRLAQSNPRGPWTARLALIRPLIENADSFLMAPAVAAAVAAITSLLTAMLLDRTSSFWLIRFREHPFGWLRSRSVLRFGLTLFLLTPALWLGLRWNQMEALELHLRLTTGLPEAARLLEPYLLNEVLLDIPRAQGTPLSYAHGYLLNLSTAIADNEHAKALETLPGPIAFLSIQGYHKDWTLDDTEVTENSSIT